MANGIPPFLPASPPPMCKLDFYDDEEDDFGEFSNAAENCYQDNISITKSIGDEETTNASQIFDPGADFKLPNDPLNHNHEYSFDHTAKLDTPVTLSVENKPILINENGEIDRVDTPHQNQIENDSTNNNNPIVDLITESNDTDSCAYYKDDESSIDDSTSDSYDKNLPEYQTNNSINSNNDPHLENPETNDKVKADHDLPLNDNFSVPECDPAIEDDFSAFCDVTEPDEKLENTNSEQTKSNIHRTFSEDSDDSNTPDIDFSCFITCTPGSENQQSNNYFSDYDDKPSEDDFGDFAKPAEVDFTISHPSSSIQFPENVESLPESSSNIELTAQSLADQTPSDLPENSMDDDFSDFVSTTTLPLVENAEKTNTEQNDLFDQSKPFEQFPSETGKSQNSSNQTNFTAIPTISSTSDLGRMYDLDSECWNEIFQGPEGEQIEVNLNTFEGKLNGSSVWCKIKDIETSPALSYNWNNSETQKILLSALYVDSRNILFGPRWNSDVPRFASNLGFSPLVPEKATEKKDAQPISISPQTVSQEDPVVDDSASKVPAFVPDAHFDWNNSGLTNPLDNHSHSSLLDLDLLASFDIHSPYYKNNRKHERTKGSASSTYENSLLAKTPHRTELSEEAKDILNSLPNLYVMEKQYIVFPVS